MAILGLHQRISRCLPSRPFGDARVGNETVSTNSTQTITKRSCSGTSGTKTLTLASSGYNNGDLLYIQQVRGTGVGAWEINKVVSGGGSTSLTLAFPLTYTFTDSGASQAQVIELKMYNNFTVNSSVTWSAPDWGGDLGGILTIAVDGTLTINGTVEANGSNGTDASTSDTTGGGFYGGRADNSTVPNQGYAGEGTSGATVSQRTANGTGGGGGYVSGASQGASGGGGGYATAGANGNNEGTSLAGLAGGTDGSADLTELMLGGGGGGGANDGSLGATEAYSTGGSSGGIILLFARSISLSASAGFRITSNGGNGGYRGSATYGGGGGGAGGSILIVTQSGNIDSAKITALGGTGGSGGGNGGVGRIAIHHYGTVTGSSNPSFTDVVDSSLLNSGAGFLFL